MKATLNFFDRLMTAVTFAEAGLDIEERPDAGRRQGHAGPVQKPAQLMPEQSRKPSIAAAR